MDMDVYVTANGKHHLEAAIGLTSFTEEYIKRKVELWVKKIIQLSDIAKSQPHTAYSAYIHGLSSQWSYISQTIPDIQDLLCPIEDAVCQHLIPPLTGWPPCSELMCDVLALPTRLGGLGITKITQNSDYMFQASERITAG